MTQQQFNDQIRKAEDDLINESLDNFNDKEFHSIEVKGIISRIIRLCHEHPYLTEVYHNSQPKAIMD